MVAPADEVKDTGGVQLRKDCTAADETAVKEQIKGKENEESYNDQESLTDVEISSRDENNENFAGYSSKTRKNGEEDEVKESADANGNTGAESDKAGEGTSLRVARSSLPFRLKQPASNWIGSLGLSALIFVMLFCACEGTCDAIDSNHCRGTLLVNTTLEYGEIFLFMCPMSHKNGLKLYADESLAYSGYGLCNIYSWLQVKCFEDGCNFTITAGVDTPKCFGCLKAGYAEWSHFLIRSERKDVKYVSAGFTNPDVKTVSAGFANSGVVVVLVAVLAVHIFL